MPKDPKSIDRILYSRILPQKFAETPAFKDFADATQYVLNQEIDEKRRHLQRIRDSVKYRRGDRLFNTEYRPESNKPAIIERNKEVIDIPAGTIIENAVVKNVIRNTAYYGYPTATDYLDLSFDYNGDDCRWLKPVNITQERDALLKNCYIMGFDFFNTQLSDEDLQRVYEYIQLYWNESGSDDNFMKFIGFIKNIRFDLVPLWTEDNDDFPSDDPNTEYPYLEEFNNATMTSVKDGGNNWLTSHVEIRYDLAQFNSFYTLNIDDLETLFYYFAPIMLVLERIVGSLEIDTTIAVMGAAEFTVNEYDETNNPTDIYHTTYDYAVANETLIDYGKDNKLLIDQEFKTDIGYKTTIRNTIIDNGLTAYSGYGEGNEGQDGLNITIKVPLISKQLSFEYQLSDLYYNKDNTQIISPIVMFTKSAARGVFYDYSVLATA